MIYNYCKHIRDIIYIAVFYVISTCRTGLRVFTCDRLSRRESALKSRDCVSERDTIYKYI